MQSFDFKIFPAPDLTQLEILGKRIKLLSIRHAYLKAIFKEFTPEIVRYMLPRAPEEISETAFFISESIKGMSEGYELVMVIIDSESEEFLGCCGLHGRGKLRTPEFGIWMKRSAQGQHFGGEAIRTLGAWAVENIDLDMVLYPVDRNNIPSRKIPESLGGVIFREKMVPTMRGNFLDEIVYKIETEALKI
ncbi:MAG: GNAT family N-acetyltransferase [Candidatus Marinimicrobia bacterium]|nr:GNAT family N-acetyltransferase [Candidatus Neomarinimicrobiota bacterium]